MKSLKFQHFFIFLILFFAISCQDNQEVSPTVSPDLQEQLDIRRLGIDLNKTVTFELKGLDQGLIKIKGKPFANNFDQIEAAPPNARLSFNYVTTTNPPGIITVIPEKSETHNYLSATNGKTVLNIDNLSGWILKRDLNGNFLEGFTLENGVQLGTLEDPSGFPIPITTSSTGPGEEPDDRLFCYEYNVTDYSRTCWYQGASLLGCDNWSVTGTSTEEHCFTEPQTGGGGGSGGGSGGQINNYESHVVDLDVTEGTTIPGEVEEDGIDCISFDFRNTSSSWQEAGIKNIRFRIVHDTPPQGFWTRKFEITNVLYFGFPSFVNDPADKAARAVQRAMNHVFHLYKNQPNVSRYTVTKKLVDQIKHEINSLGVGGRVDGYGTGSATTVVKSALYRTFGNGTCN